MNYSYFLPYLIVMAASTFAVRVIPFVLMRKKIENRFIKSFLYYVPYTVLAAMTFPAMLFATNHVLTALAGLVTGIIIAYKGHGLLTVAVGTCSAVLVTELLFLVI
ncbi:MAG: AzlD domain-containing protein [Bacillota bacterium]|nr:AzlD domain-containing protein [Bacillota bacterium]